MREIFESLQRSSAEPANSVAETLQPPQDKEPFHRCALWRAFSSTLGAASEDQPRH